MGKLSDEVLENISGGRDLVNETIGEMRHGKKKSPVLEDLGLYGAQDDYKEDKTKAALDAIHKQQLEKNKKSFL